MTQTLHLTPNRKRRAIVNMELNIITRTPSTQELDVDLIHPWFGLD